MNADEIIAMVFRRNQFYRRQYLLALAAFALALIVIGFLSWMTVYLYKNPTRPLYFATDEVGRLIQIIPLDRPNMTPEQVTAWTVEAVQNATSYDFVNFRTQLQRAQRYFSSFGWTNYMSALEFSGNLLALTTRKQIVMARVVDQPKLVTEGLLAGAYAWKYQIQLLVTYWEPPYDNKPEHRYSNALEVNVIVQRQPILQSYRGLAVVQFIATLPTTGPTQPQQLTVPTTS